MVATPGKINSTPRSFDIVNEDARKFKELQNKFPAQYENVFPDKMAAKTVVIIPSLTLDQEILNKVD
jgi:hypothetical protein